MSDYRNFFNRVLTLSAFVFLSLSINKAVAQDGKALFQSMCAACHKIDKPFTGPALKGWADRVPSKEWLYKWVHNPGAMLATDAYAKEMAKPFLPTVMTGFPQLKTEEIDAIMKYVDDWKPEVPAAAAAAAPSKPSTWLYLLLTLVLATVVYIMTKVNRSLRNVSDEKNNIRRSGPFPLYRRKSFIVTVALILAAIVGYAFFGGASILGRQQNYMPTQPIFYSHKVHAGINQISCLYCHGGAQQSKQAGIPSVNVCMNCHKSIKEYTGTEPLVKADGTKVDGTAEIQKLYAYAGWNPDTKSYNPDTNGDGIPDGAKPIEWVKIHNLPDHVYFNHSQHVKVGQQACQTCHGNIQEMPEVKQFSDLSMGWCVNCHRTTKVDFFKATDSSGNKFYSIYEKFHQDMKAGKMDSVTVEHIGGTECQKCHY